MDLLIDSPSYPTVFDRDEQLLLPQKGTSTIGTRRSQLDEFMWVDLHLFG